MKTLTAVIDMKTGSIVVFSSSTPASVANERRIPESGTSNHDCSRTPAVAIPAITKESVRKLRSKCLRCSAKRRMLGKAQEWKLFKAASQLILIIEHARYHVS